MKNSNFISDVQKLKNALESKDLKFIKEQVKSAFYVTYSNTGKEVIENEIGIDILKLVIENANDFTKDIATKSLENKYELTEKQAWCIAYQVINNIELYVISYNETLEIEEVKFSNETYSYDNEESKAEKFMKNINEIVEADRKGKTRFEGYMIRHSSEPRYFTKFQEDYWKQWSLAIQKARVFTDLDKALDILNDLNEKERTPYQIKNVLKNEKLHTIEKTEIFR